ncbi:protein MIS12 homolog [Microplitis mediator]|uniref:protein MIS12 homolog n=1 Tax=Microplitis mediator TaxID=375433 RepID=UPI0025560ED9|nr:protein MIS12 homolog [Microplitis mediator]
MDLKLKKRKREEYEMQLFGFHSRRVYKTLTSLIGEKIETRCQKIHDALVKKYELVGEDAELLEKNRKKLTTAYYRKCRSYLPRIKNCVDKLVSIPQHILLEEDKIQATQFTAEEFEQMNKNLQDLQQRIKRATMLNGVLKQELDVAQDFENNVNVSNRLCTAIENGIQYPEVDEIMTTVVGQLKEIDCEVDEFCINGRHKNNCLGFTAREFNTNDL